MAFVNEKARYNFVNSCKQQLRCFVERLSSLPRENSFVADTNEMKQNAELEKEIQRQMHFFFHYVISTCCLILPSFRTYAAVHGHHYTRSALCALLYFNRTHRVTKQCASMCAFAVHKSMKLWIPPVARSLSLSFGYVLSFVLITSVHMLRFQCADNVCTERIARRLSDDDSF